MAYYENIVMQDGDMPEGDMPTQPTEDDGMGTTPPPAPGDGDEDMGN